jgi:hypothetical protein
MNRINSSKSEFGEMPLSRLHQQELAAMKSKRKVKQQRRPIPRSILNQMLADLEQRAERQYKLVEAIQALIEPNGQTAHGEHMIRIAIGAAITTLATGMRDLSGLASILAEDRTVQS